MYSFTQRFELNVTSAQVNVNCEFKDSTTLLISLQIILFFSIIQFVKEALHLREERLKLVEADRATPPPYSPVKPLTSHT